MKFEDIVCFKCKHYKPLTYKDTHRVPDEWVNEVCKYSDYYCLKCRDFEVKDE